MADRDADGFERRLAPFRGRLAFARAVEDAEVGLAAGAGLFLALGILRWTDLLASDPARAAAAGACLALAVPAAGLLLRRTSAHRVATLVDERLGLAERVATALSLESGGTPHTPLAPLVREDADRALAALPAGALGRAFRPRLFPRPLGGAAAALALALLAFSMEPLAEAKEIPKDPVAAYRENEEKKEAAKAARKVLEEARKAEELADPKHAALRALAAEMRRQAEEMLRQNPPKAAAMAQFQKMGELARERQELLAGMDPQKLEALRVAGDTGKMDGDLGKLLQKLAAADLAGLNEALKALDRDLKGGAGAKEWTPEQLAALKDALDALAETLKDGAGTLADRKALQSALRALGDPELLAELSKRMGRLMETLTKQGWKPCQSAGGLNADGLGDSDPGDALTLTDAELQAMIDRLKELQELADLGQMALCQNCGLTAAGT
jgi:hypothetical protein